MRGGGRETEAAAWGRPRPTRGRLRSLAFAPPCSSIRLLTVVHLGLGGDLSEHHDHAGLGAGLCRRTSTQRSRTTVSDGQTATSRGDRPRRPAQRGRGSDTSCLLSASCTRMHRAWAQAPRGQATGRGRRLALRCAALASLRLSVCVSVRTARDLGQGVVLEARIEDGIRHLIADLVCEAEQRRSWQCTRVSGGGRRALRSAAGLAAAARRCCCCCRSPSPCCPLLCSYRGVPR